MRTIGILLAGLALGACNFGPQTADERLILATFSDAEAGRIVSFSDRLTQDFLLAGFRGGLGSNPPREYLMASVREIRETIGIATSLIVLPQRSFAVPSDQAARALGLAPGLAVQNARISVVQLRAQYGYPHRMFLGEFRDFGYMSIVRGEVYRSDCSLAAAGADECQGEAHVEEKISSFSITDPCLLAAERAEHDCR